MNEKRFNVFYSPLTGLFVVTDNEHKEVFEGIKSYGNACRFVNLLNAIYEENQIFRTFIELNDFDADEIIRQGKGLE